MFKTFQPLPEPLQHFASGQTTHKLLISGGSPWSAAPTIVHSQNEGDFPNRALQFAFATTSNGFILKAVC
jgi:hypothetical protein